MELLAQRTSEEQLERENFKRRKLRQIQVREQTNEWIDRNRKKYLEEREKQIKLISNALLEEIQKEEIKRIEKMEKLYDLAAAEVGAAHRAAANLPDFQALESDRQQENLKLAKSRGVQALSQEKHVVSQQLQAKQKAKIQRENLRREEDERLKMTAAKAAARMSRNHAAGDHDKKSKIRPDYQPSLANILRIPKRDLTDFARHKHKKFDAVKKHDVTYYDTSRPQGRLKYPQPVGLVEKHGYSKPNAFDLAREVVKEQRRVEIQRQSIRNRHEEVAEKRGKSALKVAMLENELKKITTELEQNGLLADSVMNESFLGLSETSAEESGSISEPSSNRSRDNKRTSDVSSEQRNRMRVRISTPADATRSPVHSGTPVSSEIRRRSTESGKSTLSQSGTAQSPISASSKKEADKSTKPKLKTTRTPTQSPAASPKSPRKKSGAASPATLKEKRVSVEGKTGMKEIADAGQLALEKTGAAISRRDESGKTLDDAKPKLLFSKSSSKKAESQAESTIGAPRGPEEPVERTDFVDNGLQKSTPVGEPSRRSPRLKQASIDSPNFHTVSEGDDTSLTRTLSSMEDMKSHRVADFDSPPVSAQNNFPMTSTPADSSNNTRASTFHTQSSGTSGQFSPRTEKKRKKALQYYITKLLQMRPESMAKLTEEDSKTSVVEIPSSAANSFEASVISSRLGSNHTTDISDLNSRLRETFRDLSRVSVGHSSDGSASSGPNSSKYYTTLSSVLQEVEIGTRNGISHGTREDTAGTLVTTGSDTDTTNNISSGDTVARVIVALSSHSASTSDSL